MLGAHPCASFAPDSAPSSACRSPRPPRRSGVWRRRCPRKRRPRSSASAPPPPPPTSGRARAGGPRRLRPPDQALHDALDGARVDPAAGAAVRAGDRATDERGCRPAGRSQSARRFRRCRHRERDEDDGRHGDIRGREGSGQGQGGALRALQARAGATTACSSSRGSESRLPRARTATRTRVMTRTTPRAHASWRRRSVRRCCVSSADGRRRRLRISDRG